MTWQYNIYNIVMYKFILCYNNTLFYMLYMLYCYILNYTLNYILNRNNSITS